MPEPTDILPLVRRFLDGQRTISLATVDDEGQPHAANVQFAQDEKGELYFLSSPDAQHSRHVARQPRVAITCYGHDDTAANIHGLQMHAQCERVSFDVIRDRYAVKYPIILEPAFATVLSRQQCYRLTPMWIRWIDNRVRFGFKSEWRGA